MAGQGDYKLTSTTVKVWNVDKDTSLDELLDKMKRAGIVIGYYVLGTTTEEERVLCLLIDRKETMLACWCIMRRKKRL